MVLGKKTGQVVLVSTSFWNLKEKEMMMIGKLIDIDDSFIVLENPAYYSQGDIIDKFYNFDFKECNNLYIQINHISGIMEIGKETLKKYNEKIKKE